MHSEAAFGQAASGYFACVTAFVGMGDVSGKHRVGGGLAAPSYHTTVRTVPYTAVQLERAKRRDSWTRLTNPSWRSSPVVTAWFMWLASALHQGPRPLVAEIQALCHGRPRRNNARARGQRRFH